MNGKYFLCLAEIFFFPRFLAGIPHGVPVLERPPEGAHHQAELPQAVERQPVNRAEHLRELRALRRHRPGGGIGGSLFHIQLLHDEELPNAQIVRIAFPNGPFPPRERGPVCGVDRIHEIELKELPLIGGRKLREGLTEHDVFIALIFDEALIERWVEADEESGRARKARDMRPIVASTSQQRLIGQ